MQLRVTVPAGYAHEQSLAVPRNSRCFRRRDFRFERVVVVAIGVSGFVDLGRHTESFRVESVKESCR